MTAASAMLRPAILAAGALAGLFGAHALDYWLIVTDPASRHAVLQATGHAWLPQVESVAIACALAAVVGALLSGSRPDGGSSPVMRKTAIKLAAAQSTGFVALELGERIFAGAPLHHLTPLLIAVGIALQIALGIGIAAILRLLVRAGAGIARLLRRIGISPAGRRSLFGPAYVSLQRRRPTRASDPVRGPPAPFSL